jgi:hypothetical protein
MKIEKNRNRSSINLKKWFQIHTWSALASWIILLMLAMTGIFIYPSDQFGLRQVSIQSKWLPALYEVNAWGSLMRSLAVTPEGWFYATHRKGIFFSQDNGQSWEDITDKIPGSLDLPQGLFPPVLTIYPYDPKIIIASKGKGLARSNDSGKTWEPFGNSDGEDLSQSGIQDITYDPPTEAVLVVDENGLVYRRSLSSDKDEGWEMISLNPPYGEWRGVGILNWKEIALNLHNGQFFSTQHWWPVNHGFGLILILISSTGLILWLRRKQSQSESAKNIKRFIKSKFFRALHHLGGLVSWPLFLLFPLSGILLVHYVDFPALINHGLPTRWFPPQFDQNQWKGPVTLNLRSLALSFNNPPRLWIGHAYGLFMSEDGGRHWSPMGEALQTPELKWIDHLLIAPRWLEYIYTGNSRGLMVSRDYGRHWDRLLDQPVNALYADRETLYVVSGENLFTQKFRTLAALASFTWTKIPLNPPYGPNRSLRQTNLYQLLHDLHSGRLLGAWFKYVLDLVAGLMILQNITGLVLWSLPRWKRWQRTRWKVNKKYPYAYQNRS